jgi:tRNA dimethylallyltransferase
MKIIFVMGPTASGKSARAFRWAQKFHGAIVNCDSIQCYQSVNIGSAKPPQIERALVRHELFDYIPEGETLTAGAYSRDFSEVIERLQQEHVPVVFVVGGTGFYFQAIEKGMYSIGAADPGAILRIEAQLQLEGPKNLWEELRSLDPGAAQKISLQDHYRLVRAVEMIRTHGKTPTEIKRQFEESQKPFPYPLLKLGVIGAREELEPRVQVRVDEMFKLGLLDEVKQLLEKGLEQWAPMSSVGYKECVDYFSGKSEARDLDQLKKLIVTSTLQLAKKQRTWFRRDPATQWLAISSPESTVDFEIEEFLR